MKSLIKTYALPLIVLFIGCGLYYVVFSKSVQSHLGTKSESTATLDSSPPSISPQGEAYIAEQELNPLDSTTHSDSTLVADATSSTLEYSAKGNTELDSITQSEPKPKPEAIYYSKATNLNIRAIPKTSGRIVGRLTLGQSVVIVEIENEWAKLDSGGWVSLALLSPTQLSERLYVVIPNTLNVRQSPESSAPVVGALYKGQKIQVQTTQDEWAKLDSGGWVSLRLIKAL